MHNFPDMGKRFTVRVPFLLTLYLGACAPTSHIHEFSYPQSVNKPFASLLVMITGQDSLLNRHIESTFFPTFENAHIQCKATREIKQLLMTKTKKQLDDLLCDHRIDGVLVISFGPRWNTGDNLVSLFELGETSTEQTLARRSSIYGGRADKITYTINGVPTGDGVYYGCRLYDVESGQVVWEASSWEEQSEFVHLNTLLPSLSSETIRMLRRSGFIKDL